MNGDADRIAYLAGEDGVELDAEERAELDGLRALLADPAVWAEPDADLEDRVVATVADVVGEPPAAVPLRGRFSPRRMVLVGGAAAAVVVVALVFALGGGGGDQTTEFALSGTELQPRAEGTARVTPGRSGLYIELDATGLPRRDGGRYYQAWLRSDGGDLVPVGTFHDPDDVVLWAGVPLRDYPTLTVTEEETHSDPASSGRRVLIGTAEP